MHFLKCIFISYTKKEEILLQIKLTRKWSSVAIPKMAVLSARHLGVSQTAFSPFVYFPGLISVDCSAGSLNHFSVSQAAGAWAASNQRSSAFICFTYGAAVYALV